MADKTTDESGRIHRHVFDIPTEKHVLLHDESDRLQSEKASAGPTSGKDILRQRACKCGATQTFDLIRKKA